MEGTEGKKRKRRKEKYENRSGRREYSIRYNSNIIIYV